MKPICAESTYLSISFVSIIHAPTAIPIKSPLFSSPPHLHYFIPIHTINSSNTHPIHHAHFSTSCTFHTHFLTLPFCPFLSQFHHFSDLSSSRMNPYVPLFTIHSTFNSHAPRSSFSIIH